MANDSSSSLSSVLGSTNHMSGLVSGLDTEALVKASTANTKIAINNKKKKLQTLTWKQEAYRDVITKLSDFQNKYLNITSANSIRANAVMKKFKAESSNDKLSVTASSTSGATEFNISSLKKATEAKLSGGKASEGSVNIDFSKAYMDKNTVDITLDGTTKTITFGGDVDTIKQNFLDAVNEAFDGVTSAKFEFKGGDGSSQIKDTLVLKSAEGDKAAHQFTVKYAECVGLENNTSSVISSTDKLGGINFTKALEGDKFEFSINGVDFSFDKNSSVKDVMNTVNNSKAGVKLSFNSLSQCFEMKSSSTGAGQEIKIEQKSGNLMNAMFNAEDDALYSRGTNAQFTINGVLVENATNTYSLDGANFDFSKVEDFTEADTDSKITVTTSRDTASIKETVKDFVNSYNELMKGLYETVQQSRPKNSGSYYDPLTEEEEEEMTEEEIEKWNEKAKEGLLYNDSTIFKVISEVRNSLNTSVDGMDLAALGITTPKTSKDGSIELDETVLESAITRYGDQVAKFFTDSEKGLASKLNNAIDKAITTKASGTGKTDTKSYGYLTNLVGVKDTISATNNRYYREMEQIQKMIDSLNDKYEKQQTRYWKKYTNLETYIAKMNNQSSTIFGGQ